MAGFERSSISYKNNQNRKLPLYVLAHMLFPFIDKNNNLINCLKNWQTSWQHDLHFDVNLYSNVCSPKLASAAKVQHERVVTTCSELCHIIVIYVRRRSNKIYKTSHNHIILHLYPQFKKKDWGFHITWSDCLTRVIFWNCVYDFLLLQVCSNICFSNCFY